MPNHGEGAERKPRVGLFVTCLIDMFRPNIGFAAVRLLEQAGCEVEVPEMQTCCGQPAYNTGDAVATREIAQQVIRVFEDFDYIVVPSGSCAAMLSEHYPSLFATDSEWQARAQSFAGRCRELLSFLCDELGFEDIAARFAHTITYHDSCSGLRELGVRVQARRLLSRVDGVVCKEMQDANVCCGFGGTFCVKYPEISERMLTEKLENIHATEADVLLGGDLGCLLNMAGRLRRVGSAVRVYHIAEVLAGLADTAAIGEAKEHQ